MTARLIRGEYRGEEKLAGPETSRHQQEQDEWQRRLERGVAEAIGRHLAESRLLSRRVNQLTIEELEGVGCAATGEYVRLREDEWRRLSQSQEAAHLDQTSDLSNA